MVGAPVSILVVDDEPDSCRNLADIFEDLGYQVDIAHEAESAVGLVRKKRYDVALLDLIMPGMDGASLYEEIKRISAGTTALMLTAHPSHPRVETAKSAGVWQVLSQAGRFPRLIGFIEQALEQPLVLVVDDDQDFCANLWDVLHCRGYRVCLAYDVTTASRRITECAYAAILVDLALPDGNGALPKPLDVPRLLEALQV